MPLISADGWRGELKTWVNSGWSAKRSQRSLCGLHGRELEPNDPIGTVFAASRASEVCWAQGWRRIIRKGNRSRHAPALLAEMLDLWSTFWDLGLPNLGLPNNDFFAEFERNCQKTCTYIRALQLLPASKVGEHLTRRAAASLFA